VSVEIWGGVECTVNRVGDAFRDQLLRTGHHDRLDDLDRIAALGIRTLRYPVLWERRDWAWTDPRLERLRTLGIRPIVTLCHHGSGPPSTQLLDPAFATGLAAFAREVAERYPWIDAYTPVNEPLTTARFSGLYGHWYPHLRDERAFVRMLVNELHAVALAMREIRAVNPAAQLVQTEDFAAIQSTPALREQADHENERRWASLDLLCGTHARNAALNDYLRRGLLTPDDLAPFPCPPDLIGLNYYLTSERLLDERLTRYPPHTHGGNGRQRYADVEAVRAAAEGLVGHLGALRLTWERFKLPLAFSEVHLGCTREEQVRWLDEALHAAEQAQREGIDARAVTAWALFGACDWNSLVTRDTGHYEAGAFDVRGPAPRETVVGRFIRGERTAALDGPGWWRRESRFLFPPVETLREGDVRLKPSLIQRAAQPRRLLITGARGMLGRALVGACERRGLAYVATDRAQLDAADAGAVARVLDEVQPWAVVNAAGHQGDAAERCHRDNTIAALALAEACALRGHRLVTFSADLVFDGRSARAYLEHDVTGPVCTFGHSKRAAEEGVLLAHGEALVIRTSALFDRGSRIAGENRVVAPTFVPDLVDAALDLLLDSAHGLWHLTNRGTLSLADLAHELGTGAVHATATRRSTVLESAKGDLMPPLEHALARCVDRRAAAV
jgi:dTDP-4-dehydrorhamnose reductase